MTSISGGVKGERRGRGVRNRIVERETPRMKKNESCKGTSSDEMTMTDDGMSVDPATNNMEKKGKKARMLYKRTIATNEAVIDGQKQRDTQRSTMSVQWA